MILFDNNDLDPLPMYQDKLIRIYYDLIRIVEHSKFESVKVSDIQWKLTESQRLSLTQMYREPDLTLPNLTLPYLDQSNLSSLFN